MSSVVFSFAGIKDFFSLKYLYGVLKWFILSYVNIKTLRLAAQVSLFIKRKKFYFQLHCIVLEKMFYCRCLWLFVWIYDDNNKRKKIKIKNGAIWALVYQQVESATGASNLAC